MQLVFLILSALAAADASAKILIGKSFVTKYPVAQRENAFEYQIINIGLSPALKVELSDLKSFPTDRFEILKGSATASFPVIPANSTIYHHIVVIPRVPQAIEDHDVTVNYTDSETGKRARTSTVSYDKRGYTHFFAETAMRKVEGVNCTHFLGFGAIAFPLTAIPAILYWISKRRYSNKKQD
ncbi:Translocon-associated protein subunit beta [Caenorhabditis elegans]|uniref:Translocon-associated protein subunit beta n=1 Tax=Caenorhabditis elegans TaxID=6239 RepID=Q21352_CAEEL|nr:Translocon-associated protein subunit beta [Caenorhabditis elegans]CAA93083.1 Translocon-associated protein subunit beta [Caenorhabditis elegans]|eukprot:NP_501843.1 Translocon-associated protein subunit beta [Caenorhabditis elegans]